MEDHRLQSGSLETGRDFRLHSLDLLHAHLEVFAARNLAINSEALHYAQQLRAAGMENEDIISTLAIALLDVTGKEIANRTACLQTLPPIFGGMLV